MSHRRGIPGFVGAHSRDRLHIPWAYSLMGVRELPVSGAAHPLRQEASRWASLANLTAMSLGLALSLLWQAQTRVGGADLRLPLPRITDRVVIGVPPSIVPDSARQVSLITSATELPQIAVPEPVPDDRARAQTIASAQEARLILEPVTQHGIPADAQAVIVPRPAPAAPPVDILFAEPVVELPVRLRVDPPVYPAIARQAGVEGTVLLHVLVGKDGRVRDVRYVEGPTMLREKAIASAMTALFRPATSNGRAVEVWVAFPVTFRLRSAGAW